jgi:catechol 2,3-dioxygenase-like lactoylglutathione lyase family enzyme
VANFLLTGLRSVEVGVPDLAASERFYREIWGLAAVARAGEAVYLRASGDAHHVLALYPRAKTELLSVTFSAAARGDVDAVAARVASCGGRVEASPGPVDEPGGGYGLTLRDPDGRRFRVVAGDARHGDGAPRPDFPERLAHVVLNATDVEAASRFMCDALGFRITDRTRMMNFIRTSSDHHSIAFARGHAATLHHIAFQVPSLESVMRGAGRLKDAGFPIEWGVGRHGPGHNVFAYFIAPDGLPIEYTAEVESVGDNYKVGAPEDWTWPPGRVDAWGISPPPSARLHEAQTRIVFA